MSNRTQKSVKNMTIGMLSQLFTLWLSFVSRTVFIKFLTAEYLGISGLFSNVLTVLSFAELGIGDAMTYAMYKPVKEDNRKLVNQLMVVYKKAYTGIAVVVGAIGLGLSFFLSFIIAEPPDIPESLQLIFWLYVVNNMASYILTYKKSILIAYQENYIVSEVQQIASLIQQIAQMIVLCFTKQYILYLIIQILCTILNNIIISVVVKKRYPWINEKDGEELPQEVSKEIFKNVKALSISKIAGVVSNGSDNIIISKFVGLSSVGVASNYTMIINSLNGILWNGLSSLTSSFGNFNVDSTIGQRRKLFNELFLCSYWLYGFMTIGIITLANSFVPLWVGSNYLVPQGVVLALVLITYISGVNFPVYTYQSTLGMFDKMKIPYVLFAVFNILLSILLGKNWGLFGVYIATSITRLCTSEVSSGYYVYRYGLKLSPLKYLKKYVIYFLILILNILVTNYAVSLVQIAGIIGFSIKVVTCTVVCNAIYFVCFFRTTEFRNLLIRAKGLLSSRRK
ncbi:lipopolysaccharide biosynthesis protein [Faecalibacterium duncaniae]|uniref:lipopolysaccharide biosynthesis protein n=1 Tax=Faecalibacterium duncaniae (strain DSM 17677 / JCM 31915 / A2-165) TaxID=411483 RepID=UPI003ED8507A